jgi:predicted nucleic acid-binding protein
VSGFVIDASVALAWCFDDEATEDALPIVIGERTPNFALSSVLELSRRQQLSAYDASYLELAMRRGVPLATKDNDLARAANHMGVTLLPTA